MVRLRMALPAPAALLTPTVTVEAPPEPGVPEIKPVDALTDKPAGKPVAP